MPALLAKAKAGNLNFGSAGVGTPQHIMGEMFSTAIGAKLNHVPYKGSAPVIADLVGGQVPMAFDNPVPMMPHVKSGALKALAVTGARRSAVLPEVPTLAELGIAGIAIEPWYGMMAPAGTPPAIVARLNTEVQAIMNSPEVKERLAALGAEPMTMGSADFKAFIDNEIRVWGAAVKASGATAD